ncbi:DUF4832 domain-containing protein [Actinoallomurus soli]|uniref:DUF4832 domain-containing protein n=1 Tax=Actinoallomurus soli TaxID=2952535 RepID=UPI002093C028|nr:DUF4832 domain-containing protein [Actinoallomurus soli]MCO5972887.1 DUF4832 domain-containing protein [Actinoallomurus soli]
MIAAITLAAAVTLGAAGPATAASHGAAHAPKPHGVTAASTPVPHGVPARPPAPPSPDPTLTDHPLAYAPGPLDNPDKGLAVYYSAGSNQNTGYPHSITWSYFPLSAVMKNASDCGTLDWSAVESMLGETASYGNTAAIRFYLDYPSGNPTNGMPPCWNGKVPTNNDTYWSTQSPDYDNPFLLSSLQDFIAKFGAKYDGDPRIGFIQLGLIGYWGEWHTWPQNGTGGYPNFMPTDANAALIVKAYANAFHKTKIEVRYPTSAGGAANNLDIGYHDDSFCYREGSPLAGVTLPQSLGGADYAQLQLDLNEGTENKWITDSMGGEVRPDIQSTAFGTWSTGASGINDDMKACIELEHTTWKLDQGSTGYSRGDANVGAAVRAMGYDFTVPHAYYKNSVSGTAKIGVTISNDGVAPFYYPWAVRLGLKDSSGKVVKTWSTPWDLRTVMPQRIRAFPDWKVGADPTYLPYGYPQYFETSVDTTGVASGSYQLVMNVVNPLSTVNAAAKPLRFANATQGTDGWLGLGSIGVGTSGGSGPVSYEAEAPGNTLAGGAVVASCSGCSGGQKAGYIGNGGTLTFTNVAGGTGGATNVTVYYASQVSRTLKISANDGTPVSVTPPATADWQTVASTSVTLPLNAGSANTITIANPSDWAPDIDRIVVG